MDDLEYGDQVVLIHVDPFLAVASGLEEGMYLEFRSIVRYSTLSYPNTMITLHSEQTGKVTLKSFFDRLGVFVQETGYDQNDLPAAALQYKRVHQAVPAAEAVQDSEDTGGGAQAAAAPAVAAAALREQALVAAGSSSSSSDDDDDLAGGSSLRPGARKWGYVR